MTVSGLTMRRAERQPDHNRDSQNPKATIRPIEQNAPRFVSSLKHGQLVAQRDDFCLHCNLAAKPGAKGIEKHYIRLITAGRR